MIFSLFEFFKNNDQRKLPNSARNGSKIKANKGELKGTEISFLCFPTFNKGSSNIFFLLLLWCFYLFCLYICIAGGWKSSWLYTLSINQKPRPVFLCDKPNLSTKKHPKNQEINQNVTNSRSVNIRYVSAITTCIGYRVSN